MNLTPVLTSNSNSSGVISSATVNSADAFLAFDNTNSTFWSVPTGTATGVELVITLPAAVNAVDSYIIRSADVSAAPTAWTFSALMLDTNTWVVLDTRTAITTGWVNDSPRTFTFTSNLKTTAGYKLIFTSIPSAGLNISEFSPLRTDFTAVDDYSTGDYLSYTEIIGSGNNPRIDTIGVSSVAGFIGIVEGTAAITNNRPVEGQLHPRGYVPRS
jgi:hypothetical protein